MIVAVSYIQQLQIKISIIMFIKNKSPVGVAAGDLFYINSGLSFCGTLVLYSFTNSLTAFTKSFLI